MIEEETRLRDALGKGICDTKCLLKGKCDECGFYMTLKVLAAAERERDRLRTRLERAADMLQDSRNVIQALTLARDPVHIRRADMDAAWDKAYQQAMKTLHGIDNFEPLTSVTRRAKQGEGLLRRLAAEVPLIRADSLPGSLLALLDTIDAYLNPKSPATASQDDDSDDQIDDDDPGSDEPEAPGSEPKEGESRA